MVKKPAVTIRGLSGAMAGATFPLNGRICIGRYKRTCGIIYPANEPGISALHCSVAPTPQGDAVILTDEGSSNGTYVGSVKLTAGKPVRLTNGATFWLGSEKNTFVVVIE